jgi:uncharacterized protein YxeA
VCKISIADNHRTSQKGENMCNYLQVKDLKLGMRTTAEQLSHIMNKYMILVYEHSGDEEGTLVFIGSHRNKEYDKWFMQDKPITPIHHTHVESEKNVVYDE